MEKKINPCKIEYDRKWLREIEKDVVSCEFEGRKRKNKTGIR